MARNGITKITGRLVPRQTLAENTAHPFRGMRPKERTDALIKTAGRIWYSICVEQQDQAVAGETPPPL